MSVKSNDFENVEKKMSYGEKVKFDDKDLKILKILHKNARTSLRDISKKVELSKDAVKYRINKMIERKIIVGFSAVINPPMLGYPFINKVLISLSNISSKKDKEFIDYLTKQKQIINVNSVSGNWDYMLMIVAKDPNDFENVLINIRRRFSGMIKELMTFTILNEYKYEEYSGLFWI